MSCMEESVGNVKKSGKTNEMEILLLTFLPYQGF